MKKTKNFFNKKIILAESSPLVSNMLKAEFEKEGYEIHVLKDGNSVLEEIVKETPLCVVLNYDLPVINSCNVCRIIKVGMGLDKLPCIVYSVDKQYKPIYDFSYVDKEIYPSDNEIEEIVNTVNNFLESNSFEINDNSKLPQLPASAYVNKTMEDNILHSYIMEKLFQAGSYTNNFTVFSEKIMDLALDVFSADAIVFIVNVNPIQVLCKGLIPNNEVSDEFIKICTSDFEELREKRENTTYEIQFYENFIENQLSEFSSYKCIPIFGELFCGTIHLASKEKLNFSDKIDSAIQFFSEKVVLFIEQAIYYKKTSKTESRLRKAFSRFVPNEIIDELAVVDTSEVASINDKRKVAILICDIRRFTSISEINQPENVVSFLNDYFTRMVNVIKKHGGTIDKFIGDAIMAVFGAPISYEDNARRAVDAALEMKSLIPSLACESLKFPKNIKLAVGIGIHYGEVIAGSIGCDVKLDYTVIGDTVNIASRLEGLTKLYNADIIISGALKEELGKDLNLLHLDTVKVKGKTVGIEIYRVDNEPLPEKYFDFYTKAVGLYVSGAWNLALSYFEKALQEMPNDNSSKMLIDRCKEFIHNPPINWDGAFTITTK